MKGKKMETTKQLKVGHFGNFSPFQCGMFHSICEQIMAERLVGIDSQFIDYTLEEPVRGQFYSRVGLHYGDIKTISPEWAKSCDILVRHSAFPPDVENIGTPIVMVIHGRPEYSFMLEYTGHGPIFSHMQKYAGNAQYKAFMVMGEEYVDVWKAILNTEAIITNVPLMVDLEKYNPWGDKHPLGDGDGCPNIMIADRWRFDTTPFYLVIAAAKFIAEECPTGKLQCFALPDPKNNYISSLIKPLMKQGIIGRALTAVENMDKLYRTVDFVLTPNNVSNRIIRESLASGCPIITAPGCKFTNYTAFAGDIDGCVKEMKRLWEDIQADPAGIKEQTRKMAEKSFSFEKTGRAALAVYEEVLKNEKKKQKETVGWTGDNLQSRSYDSYQAYLAHQKSKLDGGIDFLKDYDIKYRKGLGKRLAKIDYIKSSSVLCLGARTGTEVKAFLDTGAFAVGIDLNPGKENQYVVVGDFHKLQYADESIDVVFTNSLDHVFDIRKVLDEAHRVLKKDGKLFLDLEKRFPAGVDKWSSFWWKNNDELITYIEAKGFICRDRKHINCMWFTEQIILEKE